MRSEDLHSGSEQLEAAASVEGILPDQHIVLAGERLEAEEDGEDVCVLLDQQHLCAGAQTQVQEGVKPAQPPLTPAQLGVNVDIRLDQQHFFPLRG